MKAYLLVFDPGQIDRIKFREKVDKIASIANWTLFFGNTLCIASDATAHALSNEVRAAIPGVRFVITAIDRAEKDGWLPRSIWQAINDPAPATERSHA